MLDLLTPTVLESWLVRLPVLFLVVVVAGILIPETSAAVYKWVDENGKVHYSDKPPPQGEAQELDVESAPSTSTPALTDEQRLQKQQRLLDAFAKERADKKAEQEKLKKEKQERKIWCARARDELRQLKEAAYLYDYDESGEKVIYSKEAREKATREQEAQIKKYC